MRRLAWFAVLVLALGILIVPPAGQAAPLAEDPVGRVIVAFNSPTSSLQSTRALRTMSRPRPDMQVIAVPAGQEAAAAAEFARDPSVRFAEPDRAIQVHGAPNDTNFLNQWNLTKINAQDAWNVTTGSPGIIVAIIDSGIDLTHPEFKDRLLPGYNFVNNTANANDDFGHGTHVAGIVGAAGNNGTGIAGMAWSVRLLPVKVLGANGGGYVSDLVKGIDYSREQGAKIINMSLGAAATSQALTEAVDRAVAAGILVVASAGNSGTGNNEPSYPAALPGVIAVSATNEADAKAAFSTSGAYVAVSAPGSGILSTYKGGGYISMSGTSMAAPHVAGLAALIWTKNPALKLAEVKSAILASAVDLGTAGTDPVFGAGRIDGGRWSAALGIARVDPTPSPTPAPSPTATPAPNQPAASQPVTTPVYRIAIPAAVRS